MMFDGKSNDIRRQMHAGRKQDTVHLLGREQRLAIIRHDEKHPVLFPQAGAECVQDELHGWPFLEDEISWIDVSGRCMKHGAVLFVVVHGTQWEIFRGG